MSTTAKLDSKVYSGLAAGLAVAISLGGPAAGAPGHGTMLWQVDTHG